MGVPCTVLPGGRIQFSAVLGTTSLGVELKVGVGNTYTSEEELLLPSDFVVSFVRLDEQVHATFELDRALAGSGTLEVRAFKVEVKDGTDGPRRFAPFIVDLPPEDDHVA